MQKNLHKNRRISECIIDTDLKFWNIRFKTWISISYQIIFFHIMHSFWVISSSKAFRSGRAGPGHIKNGFFEWKWVFFVFTPYVYHQYWPSYGDTKNPIYVTKKICDLASLRSASVVTICWLIQQKWQHCYTGCLKKNATQL